MIQEGDRRCAMASRMGATLEELRRMATQVNDRAPEISEFDPGGSNLRFVAGGLDMAIRHLAVIVTAMRLDGRDVTPRD